MPNPTLWPLAPNIDTPVRERRAFLTSVLPSRRRSEQRVRLRRHELGGVEFSFFCDDPWEGRRIQALLHRRQAQQWAVPLWQYQTPLTSSISAGVVAVPAVTTDLPFQDSGGLGKHAMLWRSARSLELLHLASSGAVAPTQLNLSAGTAAAWTAGALVLPVRLARVDGFPELDWPTPSLLLGSIKFVFDVYETEASVPAEDHWVMFDEMLAPSGPEGEP